ncbi:hypothetical protein HCC74_06885 [Lentilactobacillus parabuchneri]|jgi:hypothetical protein|uniref:D-alanyl-D-alanine carboxypeptidase n=2 Tax=Lentilactobacillus parabuchneri TaxID=152331 RepID=A0A844EET0_9LACO|nr:hypothetical protein [Lentilactobacillus parabuchneri]APR06623.1 hypothetical protein FAM21731_00407 [Lentilactobacillus parabuchneri]MBW0223869.1 hypothetical protein [Lentilactobacillus parabuchneri]MBW0246820.1 hypothetical protein [Lentilactobacillus parabuchneri]MBW0264698.1 hypothetical protein [Lentilactobacillus parabuchneri]MCT2884382.1 hypothetical protein [Lentilactobacillus parabuchneri]
MYKASKLASIALLSFTLGVTTISTMQPSGTSIAMAKKRAHRQANRVLSYTSLSGTTPYTANGGKLYSSASLSGKSRNAGNYLQTTLYAFKSARVRKPTGKIAVYYYVENSTGNINGWIWRGNLSQKKSYDQETADIRAMIAIVRTMSPDSQDDILDNVTNISPKAAYNDGDTSDNWDIGSVIGQMRDDADDSGDKADILAIEKAYNLFKGRFDTLNNNKLGALHDRYVEALNNDDAGDAAWNLANTLSGAVFNMQ